MILAEKESQLCQLADGHSLIEQMANDANEDEQQLTGGDVGMLIIKYVLQSVVEQRVCQTVRTEKLVFFHLVVLQFGLSLIFTDCLFPFLFLFA